MSGNTFTNKLFGSVQVTKTFSGVDTLPDAFRIKAEWPIAMAQEGDAQTITVYLNITDGAAFALPEGATLPIGVSITQTIGTATTDPQYRWTISGLPVGTQVTFTEENYNVPGYNVTSTVTVGSGSAENGISGTIPAAATPGRVDFTNTYEAGAELPSTGGPGTVLYTATGLTLLLGASLWLFLRRKKQTT